MQIGSNRSGPAWVVVSSVESSCVAVEATTKGERTKRALVDAATAVFLDKGIFDARIRDITDAAGVSPGAFYQYFESKDEILAVAVEETMAESLQALGRKIGDDSTPLFVRIGCANRRYIRAYQHNANVIRMLEQRVAVDEAFHHSRRDMHPIFVNRLTRGLSRHQRLGSIPAALDLERASPALTAVVDNQSYIAFVLRASTHAHPEIEDTIDMVWGNVLGLPWDESELAAVRARERAEPVRPEVYTPRLHVERTTPPTGRGVRTRDQVLHAARAEFEQSGYLDATVANITSRAEVAHGTFYRYFESRFDVFAALVDRMQAEIVDELDRADRDHQAASDRLFAGLDRAIRYYVRNVRFLAVLEQFASIDAECAAVRLELRNAFIDRVCGSIAELQSDGCADDRLAPRATADVLVSMFERSMYEWHVLGVPADIAAGEAYLPTIWRRALRLDASAVG